MQAAIEDYLEHLRGERDASAHTLRNYRVDLGQFVAYLGERPGGKNFTLLALTRLDHYCGQFFSPPSGHSYRHDVSAPLTLMPRTTACSCP